MAAPDDLRESEHTGHLEVGFGHTTDWGGLQPQIAHSQGLLS